MVIIFSNKDNASPKMDRDDINQLFSTSKSPNTDWPYSKAYISWDLLFCSWQAWIDINTMQIVKWWIERETRQVCRNISYLLEEYWTSLKNVVKTTIYLKNMNDYETVNNIYKNYFILKPARTVVEVSKLQKWALIEIEVIAKR